jgi:cytidine deaminase
LRQKSKVPGDFGFFIYLSKSRKAAMKESSRSHPAAPENEKKSDPQGLIRLALEALPRARATYSHFTVAAALRGVSGRVYLGVNIENSSYGLTICAERVALFKALSDGETAFREIAIVTGAGIICPPCGACRQVMWEMAQNIDVILAASEKKYEIVSLSELLPRAFDDRLLHS